MARDKFQKLPYILGLDLGIGSVGWSIVETKSATTVKPKRLIDAGVRIFHTAEVPKNGESLNVQRRMARSLRKRLRRKRQRQNSALREISEQFQLDKKTILHSSRPDPWSLRVKGLDHLLTDIEFSRAVYHIIKHRGFKSSRKDALTVTAKKSEDGLMLSAVTANERIVQNYRSFAEMIVSESKKADSQLFGRKRNTKGIYVATPTRRLIEDELVMLGKLQQKYGNTKITDQFVSKLQNIITTQNAFGTRDGILEKVGMCSLYPEEKRAPKYSIAFQNFQSWQALNNLRLLDTSCNVERGLTLAEKQLLFSKLDEEKNITFSGARKLLKLTDDYIFKGLRYNLIDSKGKRKNPELNSLIQRQMYHDLKKLISAVDTKYWAEIASDIDLLENIVLELTLCTTNAELSQFLAKLSLPDQIINSLLQIPSITGFAHISLKAIRALLPHIMNGDSYADACLKNGLSIGGIKKAGLLPVIDVKDIKNPVVLRAVTQCRKVLKAIYSYYGPPLRIHLEMTRDLSRSYDERKKIEKEQDSNAELKAQESKLLADEFGIKNPSGTNRLKYRLWKEQCDVCAYSGKQITREMLFDDNQTQIDHALPFSRTLDDTYLNKVLVLTSENQKKLDMTPFEYLGGIDNKEIWQIFEKRVDSWKIPDRKKMTLLRKNVSKSLKINGETLEFRERDINDTRYISRFMREYLENYMPFAGSERRRVIVFSGPITSYFRNYWGLGKDRSNHRHHAIDAVVLACIDSYMLEEVVSWAKNRELKNMYRLDFPTPWISFNKDIRYRLLEDRITDFWERPELSLLYADVKDEEVIKPLFVSHAPRRSVSGRIHEETFYSTKLLPEGVLSIRKEIQDPKQIKLKNGLTSTQNKQILTENANSYVLIKRGESAVAAKNDSMIRIDIFCKDKKYYVIPVYTSDVYSNKLPMAIIQTNKSREYWPVVDTNYSFSLSIYPGDYVELVRKNDEILSGYFVKAHSGNASITLVTSTGDTTYSDIGIQKMKSIKKYNIDPLGRKSLVNKETRVPLTLKTNKTKK